MGQEWGTASLGGNLAQAYLTKWLRYTAQPLMRFRQVCDVKEAIGTGKGDTFNWDIVANIATQGTTLTETSTMPSSNFTVTKGTCVVYEFGNSVPFTRLLKELSQHELDGVGNGIIRKTLANDMAKTIDQYIYNQVKTTKLVFQQSAGTDTASVVLYTNGTGTQTNATALTSKHIINIVDAMKERNIPAFDGEDYVAIGQPTAFSALRQELQAVNQYTESGYKKVLSGEIGRYGGVRFVEQTNVAKVTPTTAAAMSQVVFVGGEAIVEAISVPEEIIEKEITDYKRSLGLAWYMIAGFTKAFNTAANDRIAIWWPNASSPAA